MYLIILLIQCTIPFVHSHGLRNRQPTHTISELNKIRASFAIEARFAQQMNTSFNPNQTTATQPNPYSTVPSSISPPIPANASTSLSPPPPPPPPPTPPPSLVPNTATALNFPKSCFPRPIKKPITSEDIICLTKHSSKSHGRYTCPLRCPAGAPLSQDKKSCICGPCWEGTTCQTPKCAHNEIVGCPNHGTHCHHSERVCLCPMNSDGNPSNTGKHCENKFNPQATMTMEEAQHIADLDVQNQENERKTKNEHLEMKPCNNLQCDGLSMLNTTSCECVCTPPWEGATCDVCPVCFDAPLHIPDRTNNCQCSCNPNNNITCQNEGWMNENSCQCECVNHFNGKDCSECRPMECKHDGEFNEELCSCLCPKGWKGKTCNECDETTTCENGGELNIETCSCECNHDTMKRNITTFWKGDFCETCPSSDFVDCGNFEFDTSTCECTTQCEPLDCQHDSELDPNTCQCNCNNGVNVTDPNVVKNYQAIKGITFYNGDDCAVCLPPTNGCPGGRTFSTSNCTCDDACQNPPKCSAAERKASMSATSNKDDDDKMPLGDGVLNTDTCTCDCAPGWGGLQCDQIADGSEKMLAAVSCQAAMVVIDEGPKAPAKSGIYWINPSGTNFVENSFQVRCDMSVQGEGWTMLGDIQGNIAITPSIYTNGRTERNIQSKHVLSCSRFHGLDGSDMELRNVVVKINMGNVTDYYRPRGGATLCEMLQANDKHQWWIGGGKDVEYKSPTKFPGADEQGIGDEDNDDSTKKKEDSSDDKRSSFLQIEEPTEEDSIDEEFTNYEWITPTYEQDPKLKNLLGGSNRTWSVKYDGRAYLSFWGGDEAVVGGCCYDDSKWFRIGACSSNVDIPCFEDSECRISEATESATCVRPGGPRNIGWGKSFEMWIREVVLPGEGRGVSQEALDHQQEQLEGDDASSSFLEAKEKVPTVEDEKMAALELYKENNEGR